MYIRHQDLPVGNEVEEYVHGPGIEPWPQQQLHRLVVHPAHA